jgi:hypothetical protein
MKRNLKVLAIAWLVFDVGTDLAAFAWLSWSGKDIAALAMTVLGGGQ